MIELSFNSQPKKLVTLIKAHKGSLALIDTMLGEVPFMKAPFSTETWETLRDFATQKLPAYERICVVGLGGSSLGTKAFAHACGIAAMDFLDNIDPQFVADYLSSAPLKKTLFFIVSKSGETSEVMALTQILMGKKIPAKNIIGVCETMNSTLVSALKRYGVSKIFTCASDVPGRFSVLTPVGLLPLMAAGIDIQKALEALEEVDTQMAVNLAYMTGWHYSAGKNILPLFIYSEALNYFADWYIQLLSESIGKKKNVGITPLKAVGVKDQHAQLQLFLDGPRDKIFFFIKPEENGSKVVIPGAHYSLNQLFDAEYKGVIGAFAEKKLPTIEIKTSGDMATTIAQLFYFFEVHVAALGMLFSIDYENQPAVELSKSITRKLLSK